MRKSGAAALAVRPNSSDHEPIPSVKAGGHDAVVSRKRGGGLLTFSGTSDQEHVVVPPVTETVSPQAPYLKMRIGAGSGAHTRSVRIPFPVLDRFAAAEARLLAATIACAVVFCGVLIIYLTAYAQVTRLGIRQAQARTALHDARLLNQTLRAQCAALENPNRIEAKATGMGMVIETRRVYYIESGDPSQLGPKNAGIQVALASGE